MSECPPCKIIIDGRVLAASARQFAAFISGGAGYPALVSAAHYLAEIADAATETLTFAVRNDSLTPEELDEAHAMSELSCHRAAWLRDAATVGGAQVRSESATHAAMVLSWAEELRLHTTRLVGGEYRGGWTVVGIKAISKKE